MLVIVDRTAIQARKYAQKFHFKPYEYWYMGSAETVKHLSEPFIYVRTGTWNKIKDLVELNQELEVLGTEVVIQKASRSKTSSELIQRREGYIG